MADDHGSRIPGFYKLTVEQRRALVADRAQLDADASAALSGGALSCERANLMVENVIGTFALPLGIGVNFQVNGEDCLVPMVVEEPSVVAAVSNMARLVRRSGGFTAESDPSVMIGQVQLMDVADPDAAIAAIESAIPRLSGMVAGIHPRLEARGGGLRGMEVRRVTYDEPGEPVVQMVVLHFYMDCVDAMGANMVNTVAERLAPEIEAITGEAVGLRILSNLASRRLSRARCRIDPAHLSTATVDGEAVADGIVNAYRFAWADPWRAATHNKGVMNGIDAVALATGNDWRAIEAGAHAWACRDGQYRSLTAWRRDEQGFLVGTIELPVQVGTVGGLIKNHPTAAANLQILGITRAGPLAAVMAAVGLAQNLGALRALATEGIQKGHMRMHARNVAVQAGARTDEIAAVVSQLCTAGDYSVSRAQQALGSLRSSR
ncbi:MAG: hydroxymethylglutaryl-CoA reductase, degradative [Myxococcota bacterium]|nr:hydroxymethylglutaryl-CoA reductase, degradative [Myxococcota bacterium]